MGGRDRFVPDMAKSVSDEWCQWCVVLDKVRQPEPGTKTGKVKCTTVVSSGPNTTDINAEIRTHTQMQNLNIDITKMALRPK